MCLANSYFAELPAVWWLLTGGTLDLIILVVYAAAALMRSGLAVYEPLLRSPFSPNTIADSQPTPGRKVWGASDGDGFHLFFANSFCAEFSGLFRLFPGSFRQQTGNSALRFRRFVNYANNGRRAVD